MAARAIPALAAAVIGTAIAVPHATATPAKGHPEADVKAPDVVTLLWIDSSTGKVTRTWSGSPAEAAILRGSSVPQGPGAEQNPGVALPEIRRISGCTDPNSYWDVRNSPPLVCFADAGDINVTILAVYEVDSGNNAGNFNYTSGGHSFTQSLSKWTSALFSSKVTVTHIHIS